MIRLPALVLCTGLSALLCAQTPEFRSFTDQTVQFGPAGPTVPFMGQPPASQWTRWPERGAGLALPNPTVLTELTFGYLSQVYDFPTGAENLTLQIYANDGQIVTGNNGSTFRTPGTLLFTSDPVAVRWGTDGRQRVALPNVAVPAEFTVTLKAQGGRLSQAPFDPGDPLVAALAGFQIANKADLGSVQGPTGVLWRRVFTAAGPSQWAAQERPSNFTGPVLTVTASVWSGPTEKLGVIYDTDTGRGVEPRADDLFALAEGNLFNEVLVPILSEGPNRTVTQLRVRMLGVTAQNQGDVTARLRLYRDSGGGGFIELWSSGPLPVPRVGDPALRIPAPFVLTADVPRIALPTDRQTYWSVAVDGLDENSTAGPIRQRDPFFPGIQPRSGLLREPVGTVKRVDFYNYTEIPDRAWLMAHIVANAAVVKPAEVTVRRGRIESGGVGSVGLFDLDVLRVCRTLQLNAGPPVQVEFEGFTPVLDPRSIRVELRSRTRGAGQYLQTLELFDFFTGQWDAVDVSEASVSQNAKTVVLEAGGDLTRYISAVGRVRARATVVPSGPVATTDLCVEFDYLNWIVGE